jgi:glucose-6-phosphate 1-dehydrogenase
VLNLVGVRFANRMLESVLTGEHVASVDIVFDESLALEGRAGYYDHAGALVDMPQSHLLQVLSLVAMEPPATLLGRDVRDGKTQVLRATRVWNDDPVTSSRRARYTAGELDGRRLPSYADEDGVDPALRTETLAAVELAVDTWRWADVPFRLRSGKAIAAPRQEVIITFKDPPRLPHGLTGYQRSDRLRLGLVAHRLALDLNVNGEGDPFALEPVTLEGVYGRADLLEYGQVLRAVLEGAPQLSVGGDAAVESWRIVEPVLAAWRENRVALEEYAAGTHGPEGWPV